MTRLPSFPTLTHANSYSHPSPTASSSSIPSRPRFFHKSKSSSQCKTKAQKVQINLELKVEKAKGFAAFFSVPVPSGRSVPRAPPSSPVLGATNHHHKVGNIQQVEYMDLCLAEKTSPSEVVEMEVEPMTLC
jgi:hypothetical protein